MEYFSLFFSWIFYLDNKWLNYLFIYFSIFSEIIINCWIEMCAWYCNYYPSEKKLRVGESWHEFNLISATCFRTTALQLHHIVVNTCNKFGIKWWKTVSVFACAFICTKCAPYLSTAFCKFYSLPSAMLNCNIQDCILNRNYFIHHAAIASMRNKHREIVISDILPRSREVVQNETTYLQEHSFC